MLNRLRYPVGVIFVLIVLSLFISSGIVFSQGPNEEYLIYLPIIVQKDKLDRTTLPEEAHDDQGDSHGDAHEHGDSDNHDHGDDHDHGDNHDHGDDDKDGDGHDDEHNHDHHHDDEYWAKLTENDPPWTPDEQSREPLAAPHVGGQWGAVINWPHTPVSMANLPDGRILTWSGSGRETWPSTEQSYTATWDPVSGSFSEYFYNGHNMFCSDLVSLDDGRVLALGGRNTVKFASIFDPVTNNWSRIEDMNSARWYPTSLTLGDGSVLTAVGKGGPYPERWLEGQGWTQLTGANLQAPILNYGANKDGAGWWPLMHLDPRGNVFHYGATAKMHSINPTGNGSITNLGNNNFSWFPEEAVAIMYDEGKILVAGGAISSSNSTSSNKAAIIDINATTPQVTTIAPMKKARQFPNEVMLPTGEVLVIGGNTSGQKFSDNGTVLEPEIWNPDSQTWTLLNPMSVPRNYHSTAILLPDARVLAGGGGYAPSNANHPATHTDGQVFSPPYLFNPDGSLATRPTISSAPDHIAIGQSFTVQASEGIQSFSVIRMSATTHTMNTGQRYLSVPFTETSNGTYDLTDSNNANVLVPGYWMLFAINSQGVPSKAKIIRVHESLRPDITPPDKQNTVEGTIVNLAIEASDPDNETLTFSATGLPDGLSINSSSGIVTGTPDTPGTYNVSVTVDDGDDGSSETSFTWTIYPQGQGHMVREWWTGINGATINNLTNSPNYPDNPTGSELLTTFEGPTNFSNNYGTRIRGYLHPPVTGNYTFWIASDDNSELWLSSNLDPANKSRIAHVPVWTSPRQWNKYSQQKSAAITLQAGVKYYIEALHKEGGGLDNLAVAWQIPGGSQQVIDGAYLSPYQPFENVALGKAASQSSTYSATGFGAASQAVDGNLTGTTASGSLTHTQKDPQAWWEVDLGARYDIDTITIWNRTDCCASRLSNFHLFVSDEPFVSQDLAETQAQAGVSDIHYPNTAGRQSNFAVNRTGRYVRVQLSGTNYLQLAEFQIFGNGPIPDPLVLEPIISFPQESNSSVSYSANFSGGSNPQFKWLFGDGTPETTYSTSYVASHTYNEPGTYLITLTATDNSGQEQSIQFYQAIYRAQTANRPTRSSSIVYEEDTGNDRIWNVNPDNDTVSVFDALSNSQVAEITVGDEPRSLAIAPDGRVWVVNTNDDSISIIDQSSLTVDVTIALRTGSNPFGLAFAPTGDAAFVTLQTTGKLLQFDPTTGTQTDELDVGQHVRHLAVNSDGSKVFVARFITPLLPSEESGNPQVNGVGGEVIVVNASNLSINKTILLQVNNGSDFEAGARGVPNYLAAPVIAPDGLSAWVPSKQDNILRGRFRDELELNFEHTVRAISSYLDLTNDNETFAFRLDHDNSSVGSAGVFGRYGNYLFVALETSRQVAVVDAYSRLELFRIDVGRAPQGMAISPDGLTLYVHNFMDRSVTVHDLSQLINQGIRSVTTRATLNAVANESLSAEILKGKQLFYDASDPRLALDSYMSCASCHNGGGHDGRVWDLTGEGEGLRNTISLKGHGGAEHGRLHWSGNFDEVHDFEGQIRNLAGGSGLMSNSDFANVQDPLGLPKAGLSDDLDALAAYVNSLTTVGKSPYRADSGELTTDGAAGRAIFESHSCVNCHLGSAFTDSTTNALHDVGTIKASSGNRLGDTLTALDTPTLRGLWNTAPYLHDGSAATLSDAINAHDGVTFTPSELNKLLAFLNQIDDSEPEPVPNTGSNYCATKGISQQDEWIESIQIDSLNHNSGNDGGYADFTNDSVTLSAGQNVSVSLTPGYSSQSYLEYWHIWIDFNGDGDFEDAGEELFTDSGNTAISGTFTIPATVAPITTRMRVTMKYNSEAEPCETFQYGEVEDYTVILSNDAPQPTPTPTPLAPTPTPTPNNGGGNQYCDTKGTSQQDEWIESIQIGSLNHNSGNDGGYADFTNHSVTLSAGQNVSVSLTPGYSSQSYLEYWHIWIDFNGDGDFEDAGEELFTDSGNSPISGSFTIPANASSITTRMRVTMKYNAEAEPCETFEYGEVEDYTLILSNDAPQPTPTPTPVAPTPTPTPNNGGGNQYCDTKGTSQQDEWIETIQIGSLNHNSGNDGGYADFTNHSVTLSAGKNVSVSLTPGYSSQSYLERWHIWIDLNGDGDFEDAGEELFTDSGNSPISGSFTIPANASSMTTRMRVTMKYNAEAEPCETFEYGEVEDYTVIITQ